MLLGSIIGIITLWVVFRLVDWQNGRLYKVHDDRSAKKVSRKEKVGSAPPKDDVMPDDDVAIVPEQMIADNAPVPVPVSRTIALSSGKLRAVRRKADANGSYSMDEVVKLLALPRRDVMKMIQNKELEVVVAFDRKWVPASAVLSLLESRK